VNGSSVVVLTETAAGVALGVVDVSRSAGFAGSTAGPRYSWTNVPDSGISSISLVSEVFDLALVEGEALSSVPEGSAFAAFDTVGVTEASTVFDESSSAPLAVSLVLCLLDTSVADSEASKSLSEAVTDVDLCLDDFVASDSLMVCSVAEASGEALPVLSTAVSEIADPDSEAVSSVGTCFVDFEVSIS